MNYAVFLVGVGVISVVMLSGCVVFDQASVESNKGRRVLFQNQYSAYHELQELSRFTEQYKVLRSTEELSSLLAEVETNFANVPNLLNRYKLILLLAHQDKNGASAKAILSLLGDKDSRGNQVDRNQAERFLLFFGEQYSSWVKKNVQLNQKITLLQAKEIELEKQNQILKNKLFVSEAERKKANSQLTQLKSIETSIIKRDMNEGTAIP